MLKKTLLVLSLVLASAASVASAALPKDFGQRVGAPTTAPAPQGLPKDFGQ